MKRRLFLVAALLLLGAALFASGQRRCSICGTVISDQQKYYQVEGGKEIFCEKCFLEAPRCSLCNLPTDPKDIDSSTGACAKCLAKLPRCKACGKPIIGTYYRYANTKGVYCAECKNNRPACSICGVPLGDSYLEYPDGRMICSDCGERAIFDVELIRKIMRDTQDTIDKHLGLKVKQPFTLRVEKLSGLPVPKGEKPTKAAPGDDALYGNELGLYRLENGKSEILLLFGLPPDLLFETAAHEYAHAWQAENNIPDSNPEMVEGFAQWVAAEVLREKGFKGALEKLEARRDFPYGTGYQKLKALPQKTIMSLIRQKR